MHLNALSDLSGRYDRIYCDIWGVLHNGVRKFASAERALVEFRQHGGQVALITNAPRPAQPIIAMLNRLGISSEAFDVIVSSGDVTQRLMAPYRGQIVHHVGPDYDLPLFEGTGVVRGEAADAKVLVVSDLDEKGEDLDDYRDRLTEWKQLGLKMICANPDKVVEVGDRMVICGGALADAYEAIGGEVEMAGKPFAPIYETARALLRERGLPEVAPERSLAIGDAERTDARGAANQGLDFLFVTGSIHASELHAGDGSIASENVEALLANTGVNLIGFMQKLA